jgi:hypothetical protein
MTGFDGPKTFRFADFCSVFVRVFVWVLPIEILVAGIVHSRSWIIVNRQIWEKRWTTVQTGKEMSLCADLGRGAILFLIGHPICFVCCPSLLRADCANC